MEPIVRKACRVSGIQVMEKGQLVPDKAPYCNFKMVFKHEKPFLNVKLFPDIFCHHFAIKQVDDAVGIMGIVRGMRHHDDSGPFIV